MAEHIISENTAYIGNTDYFGVLSPHNRSTPKYYANKLNNSGRVLDKDTGDYFKSALGDSYAEIRLLPISGSPSDIANSSWSADDYSKINSYIGFFAVQISEQSAEKYEVIPLVGDDFATFFYGASPREVTINGIVFNTIEDNWRDAFDILYREYARGTSAAKSSAIAQIKYGDRVITGYIVAFDTSLDAASPAVASFNCKMVVRDVAYTSVQNKDELLRKYSFQSELVDVSAQSKFKYLDSNRLNAVRNFTRTGTIVPAKRPPAPRKALGAVANAKNCILQTNDSGNVTGAFNGSVKDSLCTSYDIVRTAQADRQNAIKARADYIAAKQKEGKLPAGDTKLEQLNDAVNIAESRLVNLKSKTSEEGKYLRKIFSEEASTVVKAGTTSSVEINNITVGSATADDQGNITIDNDANTQLVEAILKVEDKKANIKSEAQIKQENDKATKDEAALRTKTANKEKERVEKERKKQIKAVPFAVTPSQPEE